MFTGIVEEKGTIIEVRPLGLSVSAPTVVEGLAPGDSIAVNGACLTTVEITRNTFSVDLSEETLKRTNLGMLQPGNPVNLERAMPMTGKIGGHIVQGHVDDIGHVMSISHFKGSVAIRIAAEPKVMRYIVEKGFIAVDGISLTVTELDKTSFGISVIPYTLQITTLAHRQEGEPVNLETDVLAKYAERLIEGKGPDGT